MLGLQAILIKKELSLVKRNVVVDMSLHVADVQKRAELPRFSFRPKLLYKGTFFERNIRYLG